MNDTLNTLYSPTKAPFGDNWCGPDTLNHAERTLVARYKADEESDGQDVEVYCIAMPSEFYHIEALEGQNSVGETMLGFTLNTGSGHGVAEQVAGIAESISQGMLGCRRVGGLGAEQ